MRDTRFITDLHKVKVVNESAIAIEEVLSCMSYQVNSDGTKFKYKIEGFAVDWEPSPKVTEPTGFGAIVEAETKFYQDETLEWQLTITKSRDKWMNKYQSFACWSDLINPVVISEGVSDGLR